MSRSRVTSSRSEEVRSSNDHIAQQAVRFHFVSRAPMLCECNDPGCRTIIPIGLDSYRELRESGFFTAAGHTLEDAELAVQHDGFWLQQPTPRA